MEDKICNHLFGVKFLAQADEPLFADRRRDLPSAAPDYAHPHALLLRRRIGGRRPRGRPEVAPRSLPRAAAATEPLLPLGLGSAVDEPEEELVDELLPNFFGILMN